MAPHSSVLAWRLPGTGLPDGLPAMGSHRVGHDWSDLAATAAAGEFSLDFHSSPTLRIFSTDKIIFRYRAISLFYTGIHSIFNSGRQRISQAYLWWMTLGSLGRIPIRIYFLWAQHWPVHFLVLQIELAIPNPFLAISNGFLVWNLFYCFFC